MKTINDFNFKNKIALIRVDFNIPINDNFFITDKTRIVKTIPTIQKILQDGGKIVLMSHLGRHNNKSSKKNSFQNVILEISKILNIPIKFSPHCIGNEVEKLVSELKKREILLLENLRFYKEEEEGNENFARMLSNLGDIYVNDAFGTAHRAHASTYTITKYFPNKKCFGYLMMQEIHSINKILKNGCHPITVILGGSKISSKINIIKNIIPKINYLLIGGGMAYTFIKAKGGKIGDSIIENDKLNIALEIFKESEKRKVHIYLPIDVIITNNFNKNYIKTEIALANSISDGYKGLDIGPLSIKKFSEIIYNSKTILWNGPVGVFENPIFSNGTFSIANAIIKATTELGAFSLVGGGDSIFAIKKLGYENKISYISTGGGAMLEILEGKKLPGISSINDEI